MRRSLKTDKTEAAHHPSLVVKPLFTFRAEKVNKRVKTSADASICTRNMNGVITKGVIPALGQSLRRLICSFIVNQK